jgi:hypothetical protein
MDPSELCKFLGELNPENLIAFYKHFEIPELNMTARHLDSKANFKRVVTHLQNAELVSLDK